MKINSDLRHRRHGGQYRPQGPLAGQRAAGRDTFDLGAMWDKTQAMLRDSIDALVNIDVVQATSVCRRDDEVDQMKYKFRVEVETLIARHPERVRVSPAASRFSQPGTHRRPGHEHRRTRGLSGRRSHCPPRQPSVAAPV